LLGATRVRQLAVDNAIGKTTAYVRLHRGIDLAAQAPNLHGPCSRTKIAGSDEVTIQVLRPERIGARRCLDQQWYPARDPGKYDDFPRGTAIRDPANGHLAFHANRRLLHVTDGRVSSRFLVILTSPVMSNSPRLRPAPITPEGQADVA
jgi:hypothetical protein